MNYGNYFYFTDRSGNRGYPSVYSSSASFSKKQGIREIIGQNADLRSKFGAPVLDSETVRQLERQVDEYRNIDFMGWAMNQVDSSTPEKFKFWLQNFPELFKERLDSIKNEAEVQKKVAMIKAFGPQNIEELRLIYDVQQQQKTLSGEPIYNMNNLGVLNRETNTLHSKIDHSGLFPNMQRNTLFSMSNPFNSLMNMKAEGPAHNSVMGNEPNSSAQARTHAIISGLGQFGN